MQDVWCVSWDDFDFKRLLNGFHCPCCMGVHLMPTEEELEQAVTEHIDRERVARGILRIEIEQMNKALEKVKAVGGIENVSGFLKGKE